MLLKNYGPCDPSKVNVVDARNADFLFTGDGQAVKVVGKRSKTRRVRKDVPEWLDKAVKKIAKRGIDFDLLERILYADDPGPTKERLPMPTVEFTNVRPTFKDVLRARLPGGHDLVYEPGTEKPKPKGGPTFQDLVR